MASPRPYESHVFIERSDSPRDSRLRRSPLILIEHRFEQKVVFVADQSDLAGSGQIERGKESTKAATKN